MNLFESTEEYLAFESARDFKPFENINLVKKVLTLSHPQIKFDAYICEDFLLLTDVEPLFKVSAYLSKKADISSIFYIDSHDVSSISLFLNSKMKKALHP